MKTLYLLIIGVLFMTISANAQNSLEGIWEGGITVPGGQLKIIFKISETNSEYEGTLDIPQQGAKGLRLDPVSQTGDSVLIVFSAGQITGTFSGQFESDTRIIGTYSQGGPNTPFSVERTSSSIEEEAKPKNETEYLIPNGDIQIGGTLTLPEGEIKAPLVIMSSGSGAQDRDSNIYDFKIFAVIAQHLADQGIPSYRYDDRGIGKSTGNFSDATLDDLVSDVYAIINYFKNEANNKFESFTALGHSQGGVVAGKVASESEDVEQLILVGSTAPSISEILRYQVGLAYTGTPVDQELIEIEIDAREDLMRSIVNEDTIDRAKENYIAAYLNVLNGLPEEQKSTIPDINRTATTQANQLVAIYGNPQMKSLLFYVPTEDLKKVKVPALVLFGGKDTQVTVDQNRALIEASLEESGSEYEVHIFDTANHLFQDANTGLVNEYPFLAKEFTDTFLTTLSDWILKN